LETDVDVQSMAQVESKTKVVTRNRKQARRFNANLEHEPNEMNDGLI
jgi:hypothetical protein